MLKQIKAQKMPPTPEPAPAASRGVSCEDIIIRHLELWHLKEYSLQTSCGLDIRNENKQFLVLGNNNDY